MASYCLLWLYFYVMIHKQQRPNNQPHPIDLKELKKPLLQICVKEDRSIPYLVRKAVKFWIENNYPEALNQ